MQIKADQWNAMCKATRGDAGKLFAEVNAFLAQHPQSTVLTDAPTLCQLVEAFYCEPCQHLNGIHANMRRVVELLSHRTAESQPAEPSPAPSGDVIERIKAAFKVPRAWWPADQEVFADGMTAAYNVARADLISNPPQEWLNKRDADWESVLREGRYVLGLLKAAQLDALIIDARARLTPKPVERVTVKGACDGQYEIYLDGERVRIQNGRGDNTILFWKQDAERYAAGLRAKLAKEAADGK